MWEPSYETRRKALIITIVLAVFFALFALVDEFAFNKKLQKALLVTIGVLLALEIALFVYGWYLQRRQAKAGAAGEAAGEESFEAVTEGEAAAEEEAVEGEVGEAPGPDDAVPTRVFCPTCHSLFVIDLLPARPVDLACTVCESPLRLEDKRVVPSWHEVTCAECQTDNHLPSLEGLTQFACVACGKTQPLSAEAMADAQPASEEAASATDEAAPEEAAAEAEPAAEVPIEEAPAEDVVVKAAPRRTRRKAAPRRKAARRRA